MANLQSSILIHDAFLLIWFEATAIIQRKTNEGTLKAEKSSTLSIPETPICWERTHRIAN